MMYEYDIFNSRHDAFRYGYAAFHHGKLDNFYRADKGDDEWFANREWQAGFDFAFNEYQAGWEALKKDA